jgi:cysteine desulfurase/selenocysteine lyase
LRPFGVELRRVSARDGRILVGDIIAATDERTRLVSISLVQFLNGFRIDLEELGNECRKRGVLLCVDAIQALGTMPFDVRSLPIDFLASGAHKWLLSPVGAAFFYCRNESLEHLHVTEAGHHSVAATEGKWIQDEIELLPDAQRFEGGVPSFPVVAGMETALGLLLQIGLPAIAARIRTLTDQLIAGLRRQDYHIVTPLHEQERSAIVAFSPHPYDADVLRSKLQEAGIIVASRSGLIRVSPHFYNNPEDIGRLLANLPRLR